MSNRSLMMDRYWPNFLEHFNGDYTSWGSGEEAFWYWFYGTLCEGSVRLVREEFKKLEEL